MTNRLQPSGDDLDRWASPEYPCCPFCMIDALGKIPRTFAPDRDAELCKKHARKHAPHWLASKERWIVVVKCGDVALHCTVPNPETGRLKDPPVEVS